jgi:UDP-N-acetylglucosamine--N-acetylmuramyl-(pentapeptide) pyrophosphoryl-undecaprenol N-acetylglucosamine transferase
MSVLIQHDIKDTVYSAFGATEAEAKANAETMAAELTAKGVPAVLVPYPYATANHQEFNAKAVEAAGAAKVILDKELTGEKLLEEIEKLLINDNQLQAMKKAAKSLGRPEAAAEIAQQALNLVRK